MSIKKVGITADNYKLEKFEKVLKANGFNSYTIKPFTDDTSIINITVMEEEVNIVHAVCIGVEAYFRNRVRRN